MKSLNKNKIVTVFLLIYSFLMTYLHSFNSVRFTDASIYSDNAIFYLIGKAMLQGKVLYKDIFDHKTPYVYFINAVASIFGKNHIGLYVLTSLVLFVTLYFTYKIVKYIVNDDLYAVLSSIFICLFLNNANMTLGFLRTEGYVISLILPAAYIFIKFLMEDKETFVIRQMFIVGILAGFTFMINLKASVLFVPFAFAVLIVLIKNKNYKNLIHCFISGLLGVILTTIPFIIYVTATKSFKYALDAIVNVNSIYSNYNSSIISQEETKVESLLTVFQIHPVITVIIVISLLSIIFYKIKLEVKLPTLVSFIFCLSYTILLNRPYTYYYTIIIPYIIAFCLIAYELLYKKIKLNIIKISTFIVIALLIFAINFHIGYKVVQKRYDLNLSVKETLDMMLNKYIKADNKTKVLSYGFNPEYYLYVNGNIDFKYFIIPNIKFEYYKEPYLQQISYIKKAMPDVLIFSFGNYTTMLPPQYFNEFKEAVSENYQMIGKINIFEDDAKNPNVLIKK